MDKYERAARNLELEIAWENVILLGQYQKATDPRRRKEIFDQMDGYVQIIIENGYVPLDEYATRLKRAIHLEEYRPKNLPIFEFALSNDLDYINGNFDTFDRRLAKMQRDGASPEEIRERFHDATPNRFMMAKQFTNDWIRRLENNRELVYGVKYAEAESQKKLYGMLFQKLASDFCDEYGFDRNLIKVRIVTDWSEVPTQSHTKNSVEGRAVYHYFATKSDPEKEILDHIDVFVLLKRPENFNYTVGVFAHEMQHVLDELAPEKGSLGPQVKKADDATYTNSDYREYRKSATERSSHEVQKELYYALKKRGF